MLSTNSNHLNHHLVNRYLMVTLSLFLTLIGLFISSNALALQQGTKVAKSKWITSFAAPPQQKDLFRPPLEAANLNNQTVRNIVHVSLGGDTVRVRLSNAFGSQPLTVNGVSIGLYNSGQFEQLKSLSFNSMASTIIPVGSDVYSDPISLSVENDSDVAVSIYIAGDSGSPTIEDVTNKTSFIVSGNHTMSASLPTSYQSIDYGYFMRGVEVVAAKRAAVVATLGSSVLDGFASGIDQNNSFTNYLSRRLHADNRYKQISAVSACISGNRLLDESSVFGRAGLARLDDDVISLSGIEHLVVLLGRNDIVFPLIAQFLPPNDRAWPVTVEQMKMGLMQVAAKAKANGVKVYVGTYLPYKGAFTYDEAGNNMRLALNQWIRQSAVIEGGFDAVIDFDAIMRDPSDPNSLKVEYNSGDSVHPNAAGYQAMANAVDLHLFNP